MPEGRGKLFFKKMSCGRKQRSWKKKLGNFHGPFFESNCNPGQQEGLTIWWGSYNPRRFEGDCICFYPTKIMQPFDAIFEAIEVKGQLRLNFEAATLKFCNYFWKFGCLPRKSKADLCMTNGSKFLFICLFYCSSKTYSCTVVCKKV